MSDNVFKCDACERDLVEGDKEYTCSYIEEYFDAEAATVVNAMAFLVLCMNCYNKIDVEDKIDSGLSKCLHLKPSGEPDDGVVVPIHNRYDCWKCGNPIRDGGRMQSTNHSLEEIGQKEIDPIEVTISHVLCDRCTVSVEYASTLESLLNTIKAEIKRKLLHSVRTQLNRNR